MCQVVVSPNTQVKRFGSVVTGLPEPGEAARPPRTSQLLRVAVLPSNTFWIQFYSAEKMLVKFSTGNVRLLGIS